MLEDLNKKIAVIIEQNNQMLKLVGSYDLSDDYQLLSIEQVAKHFGVDTSTIRRWGDDGELKKTKIGRSVFFSKAEIKRASLDGGLKFRLHAYHSSNQQFTTLCEFTFPPASQDHWISIAILWV